MSPDTPGEVCAYCGDDCLNEDPFAWDAGYPYCSEDCFEAAEQEKHGDG